MKRGKVVVLKKRVSFDQQEVRIYDAEPGALGRGYLSAAALRVLPPRLRRPFCDEFDLKFSDGSVVEGCVIFRDALGDGADFTYRTERLRR
jgi:hypothetical protein